MREECLLFFFSTFRVFKAPSRKRHRLVWFPHGVLYLTVEDHEPHLVGPALPSVVGVFSGRLTKKGRPTLNVTVPSMGRDPGLNRKEKVNGAAVSVSLCFLTADAV